MNKKDFLTGTLCFSILLAGGLNYYKLKQIIALQKPLKINNVQLNEPCKAKVKVAGAVVNPGEIIVEGYPPRLYEAIQLCGGLTDNAAMDKINYAMPLMDIQLVHIPFSFEQEVKFIKKNHPEKTKAASKTKKKTSSSIPKRIPQTNEGKINVNTASKLGLTRLPGVGGTLADRIISYRKNKPVKKPEDLLNVKGIGKKKLEMIRPYIIF
jgi:competence protein ComEA